MKSVSSKFHYVNLAAVNFQMSIFHVWMKRCRKQPGDRNMQEYGFNSMKIDADDDTEKRENLLKDYIHRLQ